MSRINRLIHEKSPYLLQHVYNPVDWYPWGEEAFEKAKREDKPIFLSIGYSTCYWCHVMEREIFEHDDMAELMNKYFVCIKVDREERPDVDRVYMSALQTMTGSGGWPMSMFLTPDLKPFYGATYIPPVSRYGMPGFPELITEIHNAWINRREELIKSGDNIISYLSKAFSATDKSSKIDHSMFQRALELFKSQYDEQYGGFGGAPKFPRPVVFNFLMRMQRTLNNHKTEQMAIDTLRKISGGGIYDYIGGGFHRYSVDKFWRVPHFEKMLYDQAQLVSVYTDAYRLTKNVLFIDVVKEVLHYVQSKLTDKDGGFYSAEDAESAPDITHPDKKEEGAFYVWTKEEIDKILGPQRAELFCYYFGIGERGNVPASSDPHNVFTNKNILYIANSIHQTADKFGKSEQEVSSIINKSKKLLFDVREKRPLPYLDDKILTSWNGLMISGFADAYCVFGDESYINSAKGSADFILSRLYNHERKILYHRYREGEARFEGSLEDYAFFVQGLIDLYEACFDEKYLASAVELTELIISYFYDNENGGFFDTTGTDKSILLRTKEEYDSAEPTGNTVAVMNLLRLSHFTENYSYFDLAERTLNFFSSRISGNPYSMPGMLSSTDLYFSKIKQIIISGKKESVQTKELIKTVNEHYLPNSILILAEPDKEYKLMPFLKSIIMESKISSAYVCENYMCKLPVSSAEELKKILEE
jgi:uncharacterized protein YyaL (SSP411 family)